MKNIAYIFVFLGVLLNIQLVYSQDVKFTATAPNIVGVGQQFTISYNINAQPNNLVAPSFKNFDFLGGPSKSINYVTQRVGNQLQQSVNVSFTYYLRATSEGTFSIPSANCQVDNTTYESNALTIRVDKTAPSSQPQQQNNRQQQPQQQSTRTQPENSIDGNSILIRAIPSKTTAVQGEQIIVTYKIYTLVPISQYQISKLPSNKGFWVEELDDNKQNGVKQSTEVYDGRSYSVAEIRKIAVFGQESGTLSIAPLEIDVLAQIQASRRTGSIFDLFDDPFFAPSQTIKKTLRSNAVSIKIESLASKPDNFSGAVGSFSQKTSTDRQNVKANDAFTYKLSISGKGNIMLIDKPDINFPQGFEVYDPKISLSLNKNDGGVSGTKTFEWVLIPRAEGKYKIPATKFSYYDPIGKKYVALSTNEYSIEVEKGDGSSSTIALNSANKEEVKLLNHDIEYLKTKPFRIYSKNDTFFKSTLFWILLFIPLFLATTSIIILNSISKSRKNLSVVRLKRATLIAKKRLKKAEKLLDAQNSNEFYTEISQALWGYLGDKFNISLANLSMDYVKDELEKKNVNDTIISEIITVLNDCEYARFAPGNATELMEKLYKNAIDVITKIENELK